ncbi:NAD-binding protein [Myxococcota bacterium]|nr:NAD-binding protein [Myxococcota bacterium]MBU1429519.1 NAD-binding protein [Myxococcota bacterium]MBU1896142.1 NAD-binding protein [Myxococcota bacterium]
MTERILFIGLGEYESGLLAHITREWQVVVMDQDEDNLAKYQQRFTEIETICGDASSIMTLKMVNFSDIAYIVCSIRDIDLVREICYLIRDHLNVKAPIMVIHYEDVDPSQFEQKQINFLNPIELGSRAILNRLDKNLIRPTCIGKGSGEIIEVTIRSASHLTDRRLKFLRPTNWHVCIVYREDQALIPNGEMKLKIADRVILAGKPETLENIAKLLITGMPQFPLQFGKKLVLPMEGRSNTCPVEASFWIQKSRLIGVEQIPYHHNPKVSLISNSQAEQLDAKVETGSSIGLFQEIFELNGDYGLLFLTLSGFFRKSRIKSCFELSKIPFVLGRSNKNYEKIIVSLNTPQPTVALETGMEIARMTELPLEVVYVRMPDEMTYAKDKEEYERRKGLVQDFEHIFKRPIEFHQLVGNPVQETIKLITKTEETPLLILVADRQRSLGLFTRNVPYLLARRAEVSTLVLPGDMNDV